MIKEHKHTLVVYDLKFLGPLEFKLVAPMPEQLKTTAIVWWPVSVGDLDFEYACSPCQLKYVPPDTSEKCIVIVLTCPGMGATKFKFWVLRS